MSIDAVSTATSPTDIASQALGSTAATAAAGSNSELGKNVFLQLLVTQLKNQDPLQPQDNTAFLAQLAQFSSLEQLQQISTNTSSLVSDLQVPTVPTAAPAAATTSTTSTTSATQGGN
jgi:flagellar basal-body rod modification protein FlgD